MRPVHCQREEYDIYIGRPSKWSNPFKIGEHGTRMEVIEKFEVWVRQQPELMSSLHELDGQKLGCWCGGKACHGDVLIRLVEDARAAGTLYPTQ